MKITGNSQVAQAILDRLRDVRVNLGPHVSGDVNALDSTLKGINFAPANLQKLRAVFDSARDALGQIAFYFNGQYSSGSIPRELVRNLPHLIDVSFAASDGYGYREIRDMPVLPTLSSFLPERSSGSFRSRFGFEDEQTMNFEVTSLHAALGEKICNVHIDNIGFVLRGPNGAFLNPNFPQHLFDELGNKTFFAPVAGKVIGRALQLSSITRKNYGKDIGNWMARNIHLDLPSHRTGYRLGGGVSVTPTPNLTISVKYTAKCGYCGNKEEDFGIPIPDGSSIGVGVTYRFGGGGAKKKH